MQTKIRCTLCPKGCELAYGETGDCRVRQNVEGTICCITYGQLCSINVDPVEKKPLYHFLPGSSILSVATVGCNLHCKQCQNSTISQTGPSTIAKRDVLPESIVATARKHDCPAIAYTYTEPLVSYEYTFDCCKAAAEAGLRNVLVTAAYINPDPLRKICNYVDAANVDLKSFSDDFYRSVCGGMLAPVLNALMIMNECGVMLEITNLLIPTLNDSEEEIKALCNWVVENLGEKTPIHFSRFFPQNQLQHLPPTPEERLLHACEIARCAGLQFVYVGNMQSKKNEGTYCSSCGKLLIDRKGYIIRKNRIVKGQCPDCHEKINGIWG